MEVKNIKDDVLAKNQDIRGENIWESEESTEEYLKNILGESDTEKSEILRREIGKEEIKDFVRFLISNQTSRIESKEELEIIMQDYKNHISEVGREKDEYSVEDSQKGVSKPKSPIKVEEGGSDIEINEGLTDRSIETNETARYWTSLVEDQKSSSSDEEKTQKSSLIPAKRAYTATYSSPDDPARFTQECDISFHVEGLTEEISLFSEIYQVPSIELPANELSNELSEVKVSNPTLDIKLCTLTTTPFGWVVQRKLSDFSWFRDMLATSFIGVYIPPPIPKVNKKNKEDAIFYLQRFINDVISHPLLRRSPYLLGFLKENTKEGFTLFQKQSKRIKSPKNVENMFSTDPTSNCDSSLNSSFSKCLTEYIKNTQHVQKTIIKLSNQFEIQLKATMSTLNRLSYNIKQLGKMQEILPNNKFQSDLYSSLSSALEIWEKVDNERIKTIKDRLCKLFEYSYNESNQLNSLIKLRENCFQDYSKYERKLMDKKAKLWEHGDPYKWWESSEEVYMDIEKLKNDKEYAYTKMMQKETKNLEELKNMYGFYNYKLQDETFRLLKYVTIRNCENFKEFSDHEWNIAERLKEGWTEFGEKLDKFKMEVIAN